MKLNLFQIPHDEVSRMRLRLTDRGMEIIQSVEQDGWHGDFYFSKDPDSQLIPWVEDFKPYFEDFEEEPQNTTHFGAFVFTKGDRCFAVSFGKSHFYVRVHSDFDFGVELAKRIANEREIKQTSSKRFQGKNKKAIRSFAPETRLDVQSGESVDYLQGSIIPAHRELFGSSGKFGTSALLTVDLSLSGIGELLTKVEAALSESALFKLPRTYVVKDELETQRYDKMLIDELLTDVGDTELAHNSYDLYGVDFIFSNHGTFTIRCDGFQERKLEQLGIAELKQFIIEQKLKRHDILRIRISYAEEGRPRYTKGIKECVDFVADEELVALTNGKWMRFNQDYLEFLDEYLVAVTTEDPEPEFAVVSGGETPFNASDAVRDAGYTLADKDFEIFKTRSSTQIEAWDLKRGNRVYAVKFGTAQKLHYVCDQAINLLELLRNKAGVKQIPNFDEYCLWLGYKAKKPLESVTESGSIILKQKVEAFVRKAREVGVEPVIKISRKE